MKMNMSAGLLVGGLFLAGCATAPKPDPMDAVSAAPKNHRVLYEDERVRILEVTVQPGEKENMHAHRWSSVLIVDSPAKKQEYTADGKVIATERPPAGTPLPLVLQMGPTKPHAIENLDTNVLHLYRVELKQMGE